MEALSNVINVKVYWSDPNRPTKKSLFNLRSHTLTAEEFLQQVISLSGGPSAKRFPSWATLTDAFKMAYHDLLLPQGSKVIKPEDVMYDLVVQVDGRRWVGPSVCVWEMNPGQQDDYLTQCIKRKRSQALCLACAHHPRLGADSPISGVLTPWLMQLVMTL